MGFKDWFGGRSRPTRTPQGLDSVWLSGEARVEGVAAKAAARSAEGLVLVLAHFPHTRDAIEAALRGRVEVERAESPADVRALLAAPETRAVGLALVEHLPEDSPAVVGQTTKPLSILVVERHPLRAHDDRVEQLARTLPYPSRVQFHLALDDALLERFVPERIRALFEQLGMSPDEEISHPLVSEAVEGVQRQVARAEPPQEEVEVRSSEEWLEAIEPR